MSARDYWGCVGSLFVIVRADTGVCPYAWMFSYSSIFFLTNIIKWNYPEK